MGRVVSLAATLALLVIAIPGTAFAEPLAVDFAEGTTLSMQAGKSSQVVLVNNTGLPYDVVVTAKTPSGTDAAAPAAVHLDAGGVAAVTISAPSSAGTVGFLVAVARAADGSVAVARRPFRVGTTAEWKPLVTERRVTSYRGPVWHGLRDASVPLANGASCGDTATAIAVGGVARSGGGSAIVTATCRPGTGYVDLSLRSLGEAGDYTGEIDLAPGTEGGEVTLTVRHTDDVLLPAVLLLAGIALALVAAWQSGRLSALSQAREEAWLLQAEAAAAQQRFRAATEGERWQGYAFLASLQARLDTVRASLRGLRWLASEITVDKGPYKDQLDALAEFRRLVDAWEPFAARLAALAAAADSAAAVKTDLPAPAIAAHADGLLQSRDLSVDEVLPRMADVDATTKALRVWPADARAVRDLVELGARLKPVVRPAPDRERLGRALATIESTQDAMLTAPDGASYNRLHTGDPLERPAVELKALRNQYLATLSARGLPGEDEELSLPARPADLPRILTETRETAAGMARRIARSRRLRNALAFLAIAGVTVWTGLTAVYFDHPFGTWRDYVAIVVWGFGAQAGLTVLVGALDRIIAGAAGVRP